MIASAGDSNEPTPTHPATQPVGGTNRASDTPQPTLLLPGRSPAAADAKDATLGPMTTEPPFDQREHTRRTREAYDRLAPVWAQIRQPTTGRSTAISNDQPSGRSSRTCPG